MVKQFRVLNLPELVGLIIELTWIPKVMIE